MRRSYTLVALLIACGPSGRDVPTRPEPPPAPAITLVESQPVETTLDSDLPDAHAVWLQLIAGARRSIDLAQFYAANAPGSRLEPIVAALEAAIARGVRVRYLGEPSFVREYPDTLDRLQRAGAELRMLDLSTTTGGILHAKYFVVDGRDAFLGSQNFDWRALEHIQELGVHIREPAVVRDLAAVFAADWATAGDAQAITWGDGITGELAGGPPPPPPISLVASPRDLLPAGIAWDLPELVAMIAAARTAIRVQLLTYRATGDDGAPWTELEQPLLAAAARGVRVELLVADWSKRAKTLPGLQRLARTPNVEIRFVTIPEHSAGFIPFARVIHAKLLVVDRARAWIGTSNWERDYFYGSRNVGVVIRDPGLAARIGAWSDATWTASYATRVDPDAKYTPPRIK